MSDEDRTEPRAAVSGQPGRVQGGEVELPMEHTARVRAAQGRRQEAPSLLNVHDESAPEPAPRSSTELAERSRRDRRRERDRRAERRAVLVVFLAFAGLGGAALVAVNAMMDDSVPIEVAAPATDPEDPVAAPPPVRPAGVISTPLEETPDLPVLRALAREGITIGAEGLPEVVALAVGQDVSRRAALESCRFAYGVWELSPNRRFRFLSTCGALKGQILVGAYRVDGTTIRMSPLSAEGMNLVTVMSVEKPSTARTQVMAAGASDPVLEVKQRLTAIRPGLEGEAFRDSFLPRNTIAPRGASAPPAPARRAAPPPAAAPRDPVLDLLQGSGG